MTDISGQRTLSWEVLETREDRRYNLFSIRINRSRSPRTGNIHEFQVLSSYDWVAIIAVTPENQVVMVRQYRHGSGRLSLEPPGGLVKEGQSPDQSGREELEEETGYIASRWELLGCMEPMPAIFDNHFYAYLATDATPTGRVNPDETEDLQTVLVPVDRVRELIRTGQVSSSVMIAALHLFLDQWER